MSERWAQSSFAVWPSEKRYDAETNRRWGFCPCQSCQPIEGRNEHSRQGSREMPNKVLIVDDELAICEMLRDVLEEAGHETEMAPCAEDALEIMPHYKPDVIVSDVWMPGMDGHTFCQTARRMSDASILMISGIPGEISLLQKKQNHADDFLIKPFDVENFVERVEALLEKRRLAADHPSDYKYRIMQIYQELSESGKALLMKEAEKISAGD